MDHPFDLEGVWISDQTFPGHGEGPFSDRANPVRLTFKAVTDPTQIKGSWAWGDGAHGDLTGVAFRDVLQLSLWGVTHGGDLTLRCTLSEDRSTLTGGVIHGTVGSIRTFPIEPPYIVFSRATVSFRRDD